MSPERSNSETVGWESDEEGESVPVLKDADSTAPYEVREVQSDLDTSSRPRS